MRMLAAVYLLIALANLGLWLGNGSNQGMFPTTFSYLTWGLYALSLVALLGYSVGKAILPQLLWQGILVLYVMVRIYELLTRGLVFSGGDLVTDINIISTYLWLVVPPALAMWYLGFRLNVEQSAPTRHSTGKLIVQHR